MLFGSLLTVAVLALARVSASPTPVEANLEERWASPCTGGAFYWHGKCECPPEQEWDWGLKKCKYPCLPKPKCQPGEKPWCFQDKNNWCGWDKYKPQCEHNGHNFAFCCKDHDLPVVIKKYCPDKEPDHHCNDAKGYKWNAWDKKCECPKGQYWDFQKRECCHPPLAKPNCPYGQKPWCGAHRHRYCGYDPKNNNCQNDGSHISWCCEDKDLNHWLEKLFPW